MWFLKEGQTLFIEEEIVGSLRTDMDLGIFEDLMDAPRVDWSAAESGAARESVLEIWVDIFG